MIFFNVVQMSVTSKLWAESVSAPDSVFMSFMLFLNPFRKCIVELMLIWFCWCFPGIQYSFRLFKPRVGSNKKVSYTLNYLIVT
jgi:hypothetical protein